MSLQSLEQQLRDFFASNEPGIFAVKGQWGVGKTYQVKKITEDIIKQRRRAVDEKVKRRGKYAYVSLFGINSLASLGEQIFLEIDGNTEGRGIRQWFKKHSKELGSIADGADELPYMLPVFGAGTNLAMKLWMSGEVPYTTICVDDIERRGKDLSMRDLLGYLNHLKDDKKCQVVIILNEDELEGIGEPNDKKELAKYREKVIDHEIEFVPDVDHVIEIGFKADNLEALTMLRILNVNNIRAVSKIDKFVEEVEKATTDFDDNVQERIIRSAVVLGWFYFSRSQNNIPWEFIKNLNEYRDRRFQRLDLA